jgi:signal transduction histidine kinase
MGAMNVDGLPAELHGLNGQHRIYQVRRDEANAARAADRIVSGIDSGRWLLSRGQAAHHREALTSKPYPPSWRLAHALAEVWAEQEDGPSARGHRLVDADGEPVVVLWRSGRAGVAALAAPMRAFFAAAAPQAVVWTLTPAAASDTAALPGALTRVIAAADEDWILSVSAPAAPSAARSRERLIAGTVAAAAGFIWVAVLFIARAVRKEAAVARMQADFVAAVSHEFRTPVTAVRQISEMLEMGRPEGPARVQQYYSVLVTESLRLQRLVETLLNFGRMEAGARRYELVETPIEPIIRGAVADVAALVSQSGTSVDVTGTDEPVLIDADADALRLALRNLLENAIKYSPGRPTVSIRWRVERRRAVIEVADRGLGIGAAEQRAIFRKFVRGRAAVQARVKGTGVGLAVVQHIVHAHGGELSVVSEPGQGSTFTIALPPDQVGQASSD